MTYSRAAMAKPFTFAALITPGLMSDQTQSAVWPTLVPTFLFFGGLGCAALLSQLLA